MVPTAFVVSMPQPCSFPRYRLCYHRIWQPERTGHPLSLSAINQQSASTFRAGMCSMCHLEALSANSVRRAVSGQTVFWKNTDRKSKDCCAQVCACCVRGRNSRITRDILRGLLSSLAAFEGSHLLGNNICETFHKRQIHCELVSDWRATGQGSLPASLAL